MAVAAVAATVGAGCDGSPEREPSRPAQVYIAALRNVVDELPRLEDPEARPVVYVVSGGEKAIAADVQARVANVLDESIDVRFADAREEAFVDDAEWSPVRDEGRLVVLGPVEGEAGPVELQIEVYRSEADWSRRLVTFEQSGDEWSATDSSLVEEQVGPPSTLAADDSEDSEDSDGDADADVDDPSGSSSP